MFRHENIPERNEPKKTLNNNFHFNKNINLMMYENFFLPVK
jgi:hypothetical protein